MAFRTSSHDKKLDLCINAEIGGNISKRPQALAKIRIYYGTVYCAARRLDSTTKEWGDRASTNVEETD